MSHDQLLNISTPENVIFDYQVAGIGSRFLAAMVDSILIAVAMLIANITGILIVSILNLDTNALAPSVILAILGTFSFLVFWGYYMLFEIIWNGQSPGKRWQRLRVLRVDGTPTTTRDSIIRNLVRIIDFLPIFYGVGLVAMFANNQDRRLGDFAAGTLVVHEEASVTLDDLRISSGALKSDRASVESESGAMVHMPVDRLSTQDIRLVEDYLQRRFELRNREYLAQQIARPLCEKLELAPEAASQEKADQTLIQILLAYRQQVDVAAE